MIYMIYNIYIYIHIIHNQFPVDFSLLFPRPNERTCFQDSKISYEEPLGLRPVFMGSRKASFGAANGVSQASNQFMVGNSNIWLKNSISIKCFKAIKIG